MSRCGLREGHELCQLEKGGAEEGVTSKREEAAVAAENEELGSLFHARYSRNQMR